MSHRTDIRIAAKNRLTGKTIAGETIFTSRARPITEENMPALLVYTGTEQCGRPEEDNDGNVRNRKLSLVIEGAIAATRDADLEQQMEEMAAAVEQAIHDDDTLGSLVVSCKWLTTDLDIVAEGRTLIGAIRVEFEASLYTHHNPDGSWYETGITETPTDIEILEPQSPSLPPYMYDKQTVLRPQAFRNDIATAPNTPGAPPAATEHFADGIKRDEFLHGIERISE